jgi:hypothetical protein
VHSSQCREKTALPLQNPPDGEIMRMKLESSLGALIVGSSTSPEPVPGSLETSRGGLGSKMCTEVHGSANSIRSSEAES